MTFPFNKIKTVSLFVPFCFWGKRKCMLAEIHLIPYFKHVIESKAPQSLLIPRYRCVYGLSPKM